jgi:parallel beta-helix repeat protein
MYHELMNLTLIRIKFFISFHQANIIQKRKITNLYKFFSSLHIILKMNHSIIGVLLLSFFISVSSQSNNEIVIGYSDKANVLVQRGADVHQQFQQSLDNITNNGGGTLRLEEGLFMLSSNLKIGSNTTIIGAGINATVLKLVDKATPWIIPDLGQRDAGFVNSKNTSNIYLSNFTLDGNKQNQNTDEVSVYGRYGLFIEIVENVTVDGVGIINFQGYGFDPHGVKTPKQWSVGLTIMNSYAAYNDWDGFTIDQTTSVLLQNNKAYNNGRHGFNIVTGSYNMELYNNIAYNNGFYYYLGDAGCGVAIQNNLGFDTRNISVVNNTFQDNTDAGICLRGVTDINLIGNTIANINYTDAKPRQCIENFNSTNVVSTNNRCSNKLSVQFCKAPMSSGCGITSPSFVMLLVVAFIII